MNFDDWPLGVAGLRGMPSYADADERFFVMDVVWARFTHDGLLMLFPRAYGLACLLAPGGLTALHHSPDAAWKWRPKLYSKDALGWSGLGSQRELAWRHGLSHVLLRTGEENEAPAAEDRAEAVLLECLGPQQRIEYRAAGRFRVRGAATKNVYVVEPGNGFAIVSPFTTEVSVSYCLHPDDWMPDADVALATKFALEDPKLEVECLENARGTVRREGPVPTKTDLEAWRLERELF